MHCFPLVNRRVICADQSGRGFVFDTDTRRVGTMAALAKPMRTPISLFVSDASADEDYMDSRWGSRLFLTERFPKQEEAHQFEALVFRKPGVTCGSKTWHCHLLPPPPPPFARGETRERNSRRRREITSYAVVGGGSDICISVEGAGTYCLDTASHTWSKAGEWTLPFRGQVEYVPELKLWFGISAKTQGVAAADLSAMNSQPQLVGDWEEELELDAPEEWRRSRDPQLVHLGAGWFCNSRFFQISKPRGGFDEKIEEDFAVLSNVDVVPGVDNGKHAGDGDGSGDDNAGTANGHGDGEIKLRMVKHKSRRLDSVKGRTI